MKRSGRWDLLSHGSDPIDADLYEVVNRATHYTDVADLIEQQTARLKSIGGGDNDLVGKYAATLKDKSGDLADDLHKTHGRYAAVGSALKTYYPALDTALTETWGALQDALTADQASQGASAMAKPTPAAGKPLTHEQTQQVSKRNAAIDAAGGDMTAAKTRLENALSDLNDVAKKVSDQIRDGSDDGLKDDFWDKFKSFVVEFVKVVVELAGYIAIACAIVALFIPGLDILATIALYATVASLAGHTFLAATGNGSWVDVAIDVFALATFGMGKFAARGMKATEEATAQAGTRTAARGQRAFNQQLKSLDSRIADGTGKARTQAIAERSALRARPMRSARFTGELNSAKSGVGIRQAAQFGGDTRIAKPYAAIRRAQALYPESAGVAAASAETTRLAAIGRTGWSSGLAVTGADKVLTPSALVPGDASYNEFKDQFTHQLIPW